MPLTLDHQHTPPELIKINQAISDCLAQTEVDETQLKIIIAQRAELVDKLLNTLNNPQRQQFAELEASTNERLIAHLGTLRLAAKQALSNVAKSFKAIKQYQQV